jgi:ABC-type nitrate/sulfonate/bicarbonate transport system ATPase subunit
VGMGLSMGKIVISDLVKAFVERRAAKRQVNSGADLNTGQSLRVLDEISLEFEEGELVCILGPSGCGKTTLVRIVAGFDRPTSGTVIIDGQQLDGPSPDHIFVFQQSGLLPWMTVWENVVLGLRNMPDRKEAAAKAQEYIDIVELTGFEDSYPHQLSGGMQRRAELARALVVNPEVLFMDEPFAGLDFLTRLKMREEIINMHEFIRKTTLFITHDIEEAMVMADRVVVLSERPAKIEMDLKLDFPHPRDFHRDLELETMRRQVYQNLGVHYAL